MVLYTILKIRRVALMPDAFSVIAENSILTFLPLDDGGVGIVVIDQSCRTVSREYIVGGRQLAPNWIPAELELIAFSCGAGTLRVKYKDGKRIEQYQLDPKQAAVYRKRKWEKAFQGKL
jgi:hypothetical protein